MIINRTSKCFSFFLISLFLICGLSCRRNHNIVPFESDSEDIFEALSPNDEDSPDGFTFGPDSIPGFSLQMEMPSDSAEVYVSIAQFTDIDFSPKITSHLIDFIQSRMLEFGFIGGEETDNATLLSDLSSQGMNIPESVDSIFGLFRFEFNKKIPEILEYGTPFNIAFDVYPVYIDKKFITFLQSAYCYTGGAHGTQIIELRTYSLASGEELTLNMLFVEDALPQIREDVAAHMAYSYPIYENIKTVEQYVDSLNMWLGSDASDGDATSQSRITVQNFPLPQPAINHIGVVFIYPMYELTPASDGCPVVVLPYSDIRHCLKPEFTK